MQLTPITAVTEPTYPTYRSASPTWRKLAAAVAVSTALWIPGCGDTTKLGGEPPMPEVTQLPGAERVVHPPKPKHELTEVQHPEPHEPPIRLGGDVSPVAPPPPPRFAGLIRSLEPPKPFGS